MRIGIEGGTFDPAHNGHLVLARAAIAAFGLDEVLFVPAGEPWRKTHRAITFPAHRLAMLRLATAGNDAFGISDIEIKRSGPTYTADTLEALAGERLDDEFWFIMGADALADLPNWRDPERIARHAMLAVASRDAYDVEALRSAVPALADRIAPFECPPISVSSTQVRDAVAQGESIADLVPPGVEAYIREHGLYASAGR